MDHAQSSPAKTGATELNPQQAEMQARLEELLAREQRLADLLECGSPNQIEHKVRNLLHELQLMRAVFERQSS